MELQISHCVCAEVSPEGILSGKTSAIGKILRELCEWKGVKIIEAEMCPDPVHRSDEIPPKKQYQISWGI